MPITANGSVGRSDASAASSDASASTVSSRSVASSRAYPRRSRVAIRSSSRRLKRRSPSRRCSWSPRHSSVSKASATRSARVLSTARVSSSSRVSTNSGCRRRASPTTRLAPRRWHARSAAPGASRKVTAREADRAGPSTSRRSWRSPRSGSGVSDSHSRMTGSSSRMTRERRVSPSASSRTAARVRSTSVKPNAARRSSAASGESAPVPARVSRSGAKNRRSWMPRTARWCSRCSASKRSSAVRSGLSRYPSTRARRMRACSSDGIMCVCCSS